MTFARATALRSLPKLRFPRQPRRNPFTRANRPARRGYASGHGEAHEGGVKSDLPWLVGAVAVTVPSTYLILANGDTSSSHKEPGSEYHGGEHDDENEDDGGGDEGGEDSGDEGGDEGDKQEGDEGGHDEDDKAEAGDQAGDEGGHDEEKKAKEGEEQAESKTDDKGGDNKPEGGDKKSEGGGSEGGERGDGGDGGGEGGDGGDGGGEGGDSQKGQDRNIAADTAADKKAGKPGQEKGEKSERSGDSKGEDSNSQEGSQNKGLQNVKENVTKFPDAKGGTKKKTISELGKKLGKVEDSETQGASQDLGTDKMSSKQKGISNTETRHSYDVDNEKVSKKGEGVPETAKIQGTVNPSRSQWYFQAPAMAMG